MGKIFAKAMLNNYTFGFSFTQSFIKHILGKNIYFEDVNAIDPELHKNLTMMLEESVEGLDMNFVYGREILGKVYEIELIPKGKETMVNDKNKKEYVRNVAYWLTTIEIKEQI